MKVKAVLDVDMVAIEAADKITLMLDLTATENVKQTSRPGQSVAVAFGVGNAKIRLGLSIPLLCRFTSPLHRLCRILRHAVAEVVGTTEIKLSLSYSLLCRLANPLHRILLILRHAFAVGVGGTETKLSRSVPLL